MSKRNWMTDVLEQAGGEFIVAVYLGTGEDWEITEQGRVLTWDVAGPLMDREYESGFGGFAGQFFTAWTANWVIFWDEYDGSQQIVRVPRNPCEIAVHPPGCG